MWKIIFWGIFITHNTELDQIADQKLDKGTGAGKTDTENKDRERGREREKIALYAYRKQHHEYE